MQTESLIGKRIIILGCNHVDVKPGSEGIVEGIHQDGYAVAVTGVFAIDTQNSQQEVRTETVFVEANRLQEVKESNE